MNPIKLYRGECFSYKIYKPVTNYVQNLYFSYIHHYIGMKDHFQVTEYLSDLTKEELLKLGSALGLLWPNLKKMTMLCEDLVEGWLNGADNVVATSGQPTWASLIKALEKIKLKGVAGKIKKCEYLLE